MRAGVKLRDVKLDGLERAFSSNDRIEMVMAGDKLACFDGCRHQSPANAWLSDLGTGKLLCYDESTSFPTFCLYTNGQKSASLQSNVVRIWDTATGRDQSRGLPCTRIVIYELASMKARAEFVGHGSATITCLAYSSDGMLLASGSDDATVLIWHYAKNSAEVKK